MRLNSSYWQASLEFRRHFIDFIRIISISGDPLPQQIGGIIKKRTIHKNPEHYHQKSNVNRLDLRKSSLYKTHILALQGNLCPISGSWINEAGSVLDHQHFISGEDGEAELEDHLQIRGVISKAANLFEGLVSTYLRTQRVPYSEWGDVMRSENEWHDCAFQAFYFKCWPQCDAVNSYEQIVRKMSFWINTPGKYLEYSRKVKDKFHEL